MGTNDRHPLSTIDFGDGCTLSTACGHSLATCHIDKCFIAPVAKGQAHLRPVFAEVAQLAATAEEHIEADHEVLKAAHGLVARWQAQAAAAETLVHDVLPGDTRRAYQLRATVLRECARQLGAAFGGVCDEPARH